MTREAASRRLVVDAVPIDSSAVPFQVSSASSLSKAVVIMSWNPTNCYAMNLFCLRWGVGSGLGALLTAPFAGIVAGRQPAAQLRRIIPFLVYRALIQIQ